MSQHVALARLRPSSTLPRWVGYVAQSLIGKTWFEQQSYGGTKIQLSLDDIRNLPIVIPPIDEQAHLVAFLDRETAKIDALVAEQRALLDLLNEALASLALSAFGSPGAIEKHLHEIAIEVPRPVAFSDALTCCHRPTPAAPDSPGS